MAPILLLFRSMKIKIGGYMDTMNTNKLMKITFAIGAIWWLTGCGSSQSTTSGGFDSASTNPGTQPADTAVATCSTDVAHMSDFQVQVMQFPGRSDLVRVKIVNTPQDFIASNWEVLMYRWTAAPGGSSSIDSTPLSFQFERKDSYSAFQSLTSGTPYQALYGSQVQGMVDYANQFKTLPALSSASATAFFQGATFLVDLKDQTGSFQVLRISLKNAGVVVREVDVLIPTFQADPARYNADSRHPAILQQLHPQKDKLSQSWTQNQYSAFTQSSCF